MEKQYFFLLKSLFKKVFYLNIFQRKILCRIEHIDPSTHQLVLYIRGINSPSQLSFSELIEDRKLLSSLSPNSSALIGFYFGRNYPYQNSIQFDMEEDEANTFLRSPFTCKIHGIDRKGNIIYEDLSSDTINTKPPIFILSDDSLILKFTPLESCYIGILSGIYWTKRKYASPSHLKKLELVR